MARPRRTLTQRELNRAVLARQLLLERGRISVPRALERMAGLQAQYAPSMYIGLWSRVEGFQRDDLTQGLERRSVVQGTLMRSTIHLVSARDYWPFALAIRAARRRWWLRIHRNDLTEEEASAAAGQVRTRLADGPLRRPELDSTAGKARASGVGLWVDLVRVPPSGTWERRRADLYALAEDWLGPSRIDPEAALDHLVRRYLGGFGPASRDEIADWAGIPIGDIVPALDRLRLRRFLAEDGRELLDLPGTPLPDADTPAPVRFLPVWDATLLVHARRTEILPDDHRPRVFNTKTPHSVGTFLVDGSVAGTWSYRDGRVIAEPFGSLSRAAERELRGEAERLAAFHG
jgi:hypothetical protein